MHASLERLFAYVNNKTAGSDDPVVDLQELRERIGVSAGVFTNWKQRGVSKEGALDAEALWGCSPNWILSGKGVPIGMAIWPFPNVTPEQISTLSAEQLETVEKVTLTLLSKAENPRSAYSQGSNNELTAIPSGGLTKKLSPRSKEGRASGNRSSDAQKRAEK